MTLRAAIASWDGKSADDIRGIYEQHASTRGFIGRILALTESEDLQVGTTWLVKHHLEQGATLSVAQVSRWYALAPSLRAWEARLHMLQCMAHVSVPKDAARSTERFLRRCLESDVKFVRAWAYSGYCDLARAHPAYRARAADLLEHAVETETASSVLARIRQLVKRSEFHA